MNKRRILPAVLALSLLTGPLTAARAGEGDDTADSRVGVLMAVACGLALKVVAVAPVPYAGIAVVACGFAFIDAGLSP
jgi:hypothetical protein